MTAFTVLASGAVGAPVSADQVLYATDLGSSTLVTVDTATGAVTPIGPLALAPGLLIDLASFDGRLFAIVSNYPISTRLVEIDPNDATILSDTVITDNGVPAPNAIEALTSTANGSLLVSLWQPGAPNIGSSNTIATLGLDGSISGAVDYGPDADFDGLGIDPNGGYVGLNREPGRSLNFVDVLNVSYPAGGASLIIHIPFSPDLNGVDDLVVLDDEIITLDFTTHRLNRHDRSTGIVTSFVSYPMAWSLYAGLALVSLPDACSADLDGDHSVNAADLAILLGAWGGTGAADLDNSGEVNAADLATLLGAWGPCP